MGEIRYTENHEWLLVDDKVGLAGVSEYAQDEMGDVTFVDLPTIGMPVEQGEFVCVVETVKTAIEVCAPVNGEIAEVNTMLQESPELLNSDPLGDGWIFKLRKVDMKQYAELMSGREYEEYLHHDPEASDEQSLASMKLDDADLDLEDEE